MTFGQRVAEEEGDELTKYFVETADWRRLFSGEVDVIYGAKGAGKSALYSLLLTREAELGKRGIALIAAENVRGATAFHELASDPPPSEAEFTALWKLYLLSLVGDQLEKGQFDDDDAKIVIAALRADGLLRGKRTLSGLLRAARDTVKNWFRAPKSLEGGLAIDPHTGLPTGFNGKIVFQEPNTAQAAQGFLEVSSLFDAASRSLKTRGSVIWVLIDRLDVAFAETPELEENALRALFKTYLDLLRNDNIRFKIFLRSDIWKRITTSGFREASHITRHLTIQWDSPSILDLIIRRALQSALLREYFEVTEESVLSSTTARTELFDLMFEVPESGTRKSKTLDWVITRTRDGTQTTAPREVVHLLNEAVGVQMHKVDLGDHESEDEFLFSRAALKEALPAVSKVRVEQTIYAEYPTLRGRIEALREEKSLQNPGSLARIWSVDEGKAIEIATDLVGIGLLERRGPKHAPTFWVPFLYRGYLDITQGTAEDSDD